MSTITVDKMDTFDYNISKDDKMDTFRSEKMKNYTYYINKAKEEFKDLSEEEINKKFIEYFGEEKFNQEEMLSKMISFEFVICDDLDIEPIPIIVETMIEDSRFYPKELYIAISSEVIKNYVETAKAIAHELRHYYQMCVVFNDIKDARFYNQWKEDLEDQNNAVDPTNIEEMSEYAYKTIEIDAFAYQRYAVKKYLGIETHHPNEFYDKVLSAYILKYYK